MDLGYLVGWIGLGFGVCVPLPQLYKIFKTKRLEDVSLGTYTLLVCCLICYLIHAIHIHAIVFIWAQSINLTTNAVIWGLLLWNSMKKRTKLS